MCTLLGETSLPGEILSPEHPSFSILNRRPLPFPLTSLKLLQHTIAF